MTEAEWFEWARNDLQYKAPEQVDERVEELATMYEGARDRDTVVEILRGFVPPDMEE